MIRIVIIAGFILGFATNIVTANCGTSFDHFKNELIKEAVEQHDFTKTDATIFFDTIAIDERVLKLDRSQTAFRQNFSTFANRVVSPNRMKIGAAKYKEYKKIFTQAQDRFGIPASVILAFWAMETDFGANQGRFNTLNALITLAHDCRRPELFRPQIFAAMKLWKRAIFDPNKSQGAWAGEIGMVQMLPEDILNRGIDGDNDGRVDLVNAPPDAILTVAHVLQKHGWRKNLPWMIEVSVPSHMKWYETGLNNPKTVKQWRKIGVTLKSNAKDTLLASLILPEGRKGAAFLVFDNFNVYFKWNKSFVNVLSAAYFATRLDGAKPFNPGNPDPPLSFENMIALQQKLKHYGHDVGKVDGILGAKTRIAIQKEQYKLGLPADAWPTIELLHML